VAIFKREKSILIGVTPATRPVYINGNDYIFQLGGSARVGYFPVPKFGIIAEYSKYALVGNVIDNRHVSTALLAGRYYWNGVRTGTYTDLGYMISDSRILKSTQGNVNIFPSHYISFAGGLSINMAPNLYFDLSYHGAISLNGQDTKSYFDRHLGIDYIFNSKYKDIPRLKRTKDDTPEFGGKRRFQLATGFFYFPFPEADFGEKYNELLWTSKFGYYLNKSFTVGLTTGFIYAQPKIQNDRLFYFIGPYVNYKLLPQSRISPYLETGYNYSNHSIPEVGLPRNSITHFFNIGGGFNFKIKNDFYLDAGLVLQNCVGGSQKCEGGASIFRLGIEYVVR
jgi:hypothetical protein